MHKIFSTDRAYSYARYSNPEYDKLIQIAKQSSNQKICMEAKHKAEEIIINDMDYFVIEPEILR